MSTVLNSFTLMVPQAGPTLRYNQIMAHTLASIVATKFFKVPLKPQGVAGSNELSFKVKFQI